MRLRRIRDILILLRHLYIFVLTYVLVCDVLQPMLSREASCEICGAGDVDHDWCGDIGDDDDWSQWLMECRICYEMVHPACLVMSSPDLAHSGVFDEDFPSSWDCARCCTRGLQGTNRVSSSLQFLNLAQTNRALSLLPYVGR